MKILLIEDDADDVELLQEALERNGINFQMDILKDGVAAQAHLLSSKSIPDIIILDFNLPKIHGKEIMLSIKSAPLFQRVPLLVLTTSSSEKDMQYSIQNGAAAFMNKPTTIEEMKNLVTTIQRLAAFETT